MHKIKIKDISFSYSSKSPIIFKNLSLKIENGEFVCLLGQSGCGKSTLLKLIAGLNEATEGTITIDGITIKGASLERGVVFQDYGLFPWMSAGENILLALTQKYKDKNKKELKKIAVEMLERVGLDKSVYDKYPNSLSGGMKQRCAIAQSFSINPPVLLMDEPFGALDAVTRARLQDLVIELWKNQNPKKTIVFVTHDVDEAMLLADRIIVLGQSNENNIIYECTLPRDIDRSRENQFSNPLILEKRNELINCIQKDVAKNI